MGHDNRKKVHSIYVYPTAETIRWLTLGTDVLQTVVGRDGKNSLLLKTSHLVKNPVYEFFIASLFHVVGRLSCQL